MIKLEKQCKLLQKECWSQQKDYQAALKNYEARLDTAVDSTRLNEVRAAVTALKTHLPLVESEVKAFALVFSDTCSNLFHSLQSHNSNLADDLADARQTIIILKQSLDQAEQENEHLKTQAMPDSDKVKKLKG